VSSDTAHPIFLSLTVAEWLSDGRSSISEDSLKGRIVSFYNTARTRNFTIPITSSLKFFRLFTSNRIGSLPQADIKSLVTHSWSDVRWTTGTGRLLDTTVFLLELVDSATGTVLATMDSVGVHDGGPNPIALRYGTAPDVSIRMVPIPDSCNGRVAFVRAVPYRYGATAAGIVHRKFAMDYNLGYLYEQEPDRAFPNQYPRWLDSLTNDTVGAAQMQSLLVAHAAALALNGCTATLIGLRSWPSGFENAYNAYLGSLPDTRFSSNCNSYHRQDTLWWISTLEDPSFAKQSVKAERSLSDRAVLTVETAQGDNAVRITLSGVEAAQSTVFIFDNTGKLVHSGNGPSAPFSDWLIPTSSLSSGMYSVKVRTSSGRDFTRFFVVTN